MNRLPSITGKQLIGSLKRLGFQEVRIRGSHHYLRHPDGRTTVAPAHAGEAIGPGLLSKILRDAEISKAELSEYI
ncbi:MAG TPA: type II toxin-antitoxin system HicA family toxin [Bryobacterales bacterium]|nr:type II toxin-antitoxin system HicA family toxin [Bryobacterales bacterium]